GRGGHAGADGAGESDGHRGEWPDQSELDGVDGRRGGDGVPGGAVPGGGVHGLRADRDGWGRDVQRHGAGGEHELQLSGAGDGRGGEPERVLERGERDDAGDAGGAGGGVRVQRGGGDDGRGRVGERHHGADDRGAVDAGGAA